MHECPDCYSGCYCGGDIDDILMDGTVAGRVCGHCPFEADDFGCEEDDCLDCGTCDSCTERTIVYAEEMDAEVRGTKEK